ncbi:MAG: hypothetical protein OHK0040_07340 [bacterium]
MIGLPSEVGPIRPPSESQSLLIRVSRNCPWNRCLFCPVYKNETFSLRKLNDLVNEITALSEIKNKLQNLLKSESFYTLSTNLGKYFQSEEFEDAHRLLHWLYHRNYTVFLQDADPLFRKKGELYEILNAIKKCFPETTRITAYSRASTISRFSLPELVNLRSLGLTRIHTGLESGSQAVLSMVKKGVKQDDFILAGKMLSEANIEFSLYVMPGLGGRAYSKEHSSETAYVINQANPSFVRFRTLGLNPLMPLYQLYKKGLFEILSEEGMVTEIKTMIEQIDVETAIYSDHNLNLLMDINGFLPRDKTRMLKIIDNFFSLSDNLRLKFIIARRLNLVFELNEFLSFDLSDQINDIYETLKALPAEQREEWFLKNRSKSL